MKQNLLTRRRLLSTAASLGAGTAALIASGRADAFRLEPMSVETQALYRSACGAENSGHDALVAELEAALRAAGESDDKTQSKQRPQVLSTTCPFCGCLVVAGR